MCLELQKVVHGREPHRVNMLKVGAPVELTLGLDGLWLRKKCSWDPRVSSHHPLTRRRTASTGHGVLGMSSHDRNEIHVHRRCSGELRHKTFENPPSREAVTLSLAELPMSIGWHKPHLDTQLPNTNHRTRRKTDRPPRPEEAHQGVRRHETTPR